MPIRITCFATLLLLIHITWANSPLEPGSFDLEKASDEQKLSYLLGVEMYEKRTRQGFSLDADLVAQAIRDEKTGTRPNMSTEEYMRIVTLQREKIADFESRWQALSDENLAAGKAFLAQKAREKGMISTGSGLLYKVLRAGTGNIPTREDIAKVHYRGTLLNGEEFDSSYKRDKPIDFPVARVKPGLSEALLLMREGAKWEIYVPPHLGYGEDGAGPIGPNETLVSEVELIEIVE